jgi:hypothetical protein
MFKIRGQRDRTGTIESVHPDDGLSGMIDDVLAEFAYNELADALGMPASLRFNLTGQEVLSAA